MYGVMSVFLAMLECLMMITDGGTRMQNLPFRRYQPYLGSIGPLLHHVDFREMQVFPVRGGDETPG